MSNLKHISIIYFLDHLQCRVSHHGLYELEFRSALEDKRLCDLTW